MDGFQIIANVLFIEGRLRASGPILFARPETRRVRRQNFISEDQLRTDKPKFELRIRDNDAARFGVRGRARINLQC